MSTKTLKTEEQFHEEAVQQLLKLSTPVDLKHSLTFLWENALSGENALEFPETLSEHYYSFKLLHNFLVQLTFLHKEDLRPEDFMLNP